MKAIKKGTKRPEVFLFQKAFNDAFDLNLDRDGISGNKTVREIKQAQINFKLRVDLKWGNKSWRALFNEHPYLILDGDRLIQTVITQFETGSVNAYGFAENDIGDNAGFNMGCLQHNKYGSMKTLLTMADRKDLLALYNRINKYKVNSTLKNWFGSAEGIKYQDLYFNRYITKPALREIGLLNLDMTLFSTPQLKFRLIGLMSDNRVQNGTVASPNKTFFSDTNSHSELRTGKQWTYIFGNKLPFQEWKAIWNELFEENCKKHSNIRKARRLTNIQIMSDMAKKLNNADLILKMLAQFRARSSRKKYWLDVLSRRNLFANCKTVVHGSRLNLEDDFFISQLGLE